MQGRCSFVLGFSCLQYLLELYPDELNRKDGDGLPLLLMALNHDLKFVHLLLEHRADIHILDDFLEQGSNILHLLFQVRDPDSDPKLTLGACVSAVCL